MSEEEVQCSLPLDTLVNKIARRYGTDAAALKWRLKEALAEKEEG